MRARQDPPAAGPANPFDRAEVVGRYEAWYGTPYGALAESIELALIEELLAPLGPGATVLEVGCGTGHFAAALAARGFRARGVDLSLPMLGVARERVPVVCGDGQRLPFADGAVDGALVIAVLDFVADPAALLREARRVARRRVAVVALGGRSWIALLRRAAGWRGHAVFSRARFHTRARLIDFCRAAGAPPERVRGALYLPPRLAAACPSLERRLSRAGAKPLAGVLGLALSGGTVSPPPTVPAARRA